MNDNTEPKPPAHQPPPAPKPQKQPTPPERTPIAVERLLFSAGPIINGARLPAGPKGDNEQITGNLKAGMNGDIKTDISWRPWMRMYYVARSKRVERTEKGKQTISWEPVGRPFVVPETMAVAVLAEDL